MSGWVIDASAALAYLWRETGWEAVGSRLITPGCIIGTVNLAEVIAKAVERGLPDDKIGELRATLDIETITFDDAQAAESGRLRRFTRHLGLSLGNRVCLALAITCQAHRRHRRPAVVATGAAARVDDRVHSSCTVIANADMLALPITRYTAADRHPRLATSGRPLVDTHRSLRS